MRGAKLKEGMCPILAQAFSELGKGDEENEHAEENKNGKAKEERAQTLACVYVLSFP